MTKKQPEAGIEIIT